MSRKHNKHDHHIHYHHHSYASAPPLPSGYHQHGTNHQKPLYPQIHPPGPHMHFPGPQINPPCPQIHHSVPQIHHSVPQIHPSGPHIHSPGPPMHPPPYDAHDSHGRHPVYLSSGPIDPPPPPYQPSYQQGGCAPHISHGQRQNCGSSAPGYVIVAPVEKPKKKKNQKLKTALKFGLPVVALGVGAYAIGKAHGEMSDSD